MAPKTAKKQTEKKKEAKTKAIKKADKDKVEATKAPAATAPPATKEAPKKELVHAKKASSKKPDQPQQEEVKSDKKALDLCLILDCTGSMASWIQRSKDTLHEIINNVRQVNPDLIVRVSFVGYRDIQDLQRFSIHEFTEDLDKIKAFISGVQATGGGDAPEDVQGGFHRALQQNWYPDSIKMAFHIFDAPGHGKDICKVHDYYPNGSPEGHVIQDQMKEFAKRKINFTAVKVNEDSNLMIEVMKASYNSIGGDLQLNITDLASACAMKSQAEVTKDFVKAASYILSAAIGGGGDGLGAQKVVRGEPLWDTKQFAVDQFFSQTTYYNVTEILGDRVTVKNQYGALMYVSRDIIEKMASATHFTKEVPMNMTGLAELLEGCSDTIFTVQFKKQPNKESAVKLLSETSFVDLKDKKKATALAKSIVEGETTTMICHLVKTENNLGRSTVIDLSSPLDNKFRQVDHRSIDYIIFKNVKYVLKKGGKKLSDNPDEEEKKGDEAQWDKTQLAVGNWFSGTNYYKVTKINGDEVTTLCNGNEVVISRDILEHEMHNASVFAKEEKLPLTKVVKVFKEANSVAFTVCFNCKVDEKAVAEKLQNCNEEEFKEAKKLAKELLLGREFTVVGRLSKAEGKLGRSLVKGLQGNNYVQVDHRTINWIIMKNVKYVVTSKK